MFGYLNEEDLDEIELIVGFPLFYEDVIEAQRLAAIGASLEEIAIEIANGAY